MPITIQTIKFSPVTLSVTVLTILGFVFFAPSSIAGFEHITRPLVYVLYPFKLLFASFLHVHFLHLLTNLAIWLIAGIYIESDIGSRKFLTIAVLATLLGGILETLLAGSKFVGLSGACYGLIGIIIWEKFSKDKGVKGGILGFAILLIFAGLDSAFNSVASPNHIAYAAHIGGLMAGFFSSLGLNKGGGNEPHRVFRPMVDADIQAILEIIYEHDEDDGDEAKASFQKSLVDKYVMEFEGRLMGMTGFRVDPDASKVAWLSFTYIHSFFRQRGNAYWMMLELRHVLEADGIERLFIATSDYIDEDTGDDIYHPARNFYENKLNAEREIRIESFYAPGESKYIYSLPVTDRSFAEQDPPTHVKARFVGLDEASESDTSYVTLWEEDPANEDFPPSKLATRSLEDLIDEVKSYNGKVLFVTLPDYISAHHATELSAAGFENIGTLRDYFSKGVGEVHWGLYFG